MARLELPPEENMNLATLAELARGGMGSVELARAEGGPLMGQLFAVKRLHEHLAKDPSFVAMFLDEMWMTASLSSKNVVKVAAWGNDDQGMFLAVELVQGVSLTRLLKEARQNGEGFAERTVVFVASEICAGLAAAHGLTGADGALLGLVHRDLTPSNVLVSFDGEVKIVDFGIAKAEERVTQTQAGELKGKPGYMAPEQSRGGKVDARTDLFSFGVLMFELLAGRRPWPSKNSFEAMIAAATEPAPNLAELRPGVSPVLVEIVHKCLEKLPEKRFSSAVEIQALLDAWRRSKGFGGDDQASLADFVKRNCGKQIEWFERAIRGELKKGSAPTFQEMQEQLDAAREKPGDKKKKARVAPAAGAAALMSMNADAPKSLPRFGEDAEEEGENDPTRVYKPGVDSVRFGRGTAGPPSSRRGEPLEGPPRSVPRLVRIADGQAPASSRAPMSQRAPISQHAPGSQHPAGSQRAPMSQPPPGSQRPAVSLRGTQIMPEAMGAEAAASSRPASVPPSKPASVPPLSSRRGTEIMPETLMAHAAALPSINERAPSSSPRLPPPSPVTPAQAPPATAAPRVNLTPPAVAGAPRAGASSSPAPKRNRVGVVLLLVAVPLLVLFTLWRFKHRLIEVSGPPAQVSTESAPAAPAKPTAAPTDVAAPGPGKGSVDAPSAGSLDAGVDASPSSK